MMEHEHTCIRRVVGRWLRMRTFKSTLGHLLCVDVEESGLFRE